MADDAPDADGSLAKEVKRRVRRAERDRQRHEAKIAECYRFAMPWRHKFNSETPGTDQFGDVYEDAIMTIVEDFAADMLNIFTPMKNDWVKILPAQKLDRGEQSQVKQALQDYQTILFDEMRRSNLYQSLQEAYLDLAPGTMSLIIQDRHPSEPIHCQAIPATELLIDRGPWGEVDGKWRKWKVLGETVKVLWPGITLDAGQKIQDDANYEVIDGCWRDWSDRGTEIHRYVVMINSKIRRKGEWRGAGSSPFVVARWSRDSTTAWGVGPTYRTILTTKALNHVRYEGLKNLSKITDPVVTYENDGVINIDQGVDAGDWIPREMGSRAPEVVEPKGRFDVEALRIDEMLSAIKRAHYQDRPEQLGKTPPTASQWTDEAAERARRMGSPATNLVLELQYPIVKRFAYLLRERGVLPEVKLGSKDVALEPVSPLLRAQEQEEVVRVQKFLELFAAVFGPEALNAVVKQTDTARWLADKLGVPLDLIRTEVEMAQAIQNLAPLIGQATGGGAPAAEGPGAGVPLQ